jgi:predicted membrane protein
MEAPCLSAGLMSTLTLIFIIADYFFNYGQNVIKYILLGSLTVILFHLLCINGYQIVNWVFLGILPIYTLFSLLSIYFRKADISYMKEMSDISNTCRSCGVSFDNCECEISNIKSITSTNKKPNYNNNNSTNVKSDKCP